MAHLSDHEDARTLTEETTGPADLPSLTERLEAIESDLFGRPFTPTEDLDARQRLDNLRGRVTTAFEVAEALAEDVSGRSPRPWSTLAEDLDLEAIRSELGEMLTALENTFVEGAAESTASGGRDAHSGGGAGMRSLAAAAAPVDSGGGGAVDGGPAGFNPHGIVVDDDGFVTLGAPRVASSSRTRDTEAAQRALRSWARPPRADDGSGPALLDVHTTDSERGGRLLTASRPHGSEPPRPPWRR